MVEYDLLQVFLEERQVVLTVCTDVVSKSVS
jgi:hypothetical protein